MAVKSKTKSKSKVKVVAKVKPTVKKGVVSAGTVRKAISKPKPKVDAIAKKTKSIGKSAVTSVRRKPATAENPVEVTRTINLSSQIRQPVKSVLKKASLAASNASLFNFMKAPRTEYAFEVGDAVEVYCDHELGRERVRGWVKGIVVQVDNKMVAVQFRSNVFLTDGWMVPDRILWYPLNSEHIRPVTSGKKPALKKEIIPDY